MKSRYSHQNSSFQGSAPEVKTPSPGIVKRKRHNSGESVSDYGWYEDMESTNSPYNSFTSDFGPHTLNRALVLPAPASEPPMYILESSLETQQLWYATAGRRPPQPTQERQEIERLWSQNFEASAVKYEPSSRPSCNGSEKTECPFEVMYRGKSQFSNSVSKSFSSQSVPSMTIQLPYYRIVRDANGTLFAEYLIAVSVGGRGSVTFGVWKRHSEFDRLAKHIMEMDLRSTKPNTFKNTLVSWQCVVQRKRWFKSLDTEYLALKCFLIERFMQDLLFEAHSASLICDFLGL